MNRRETSFFHVEQGKNPRIAAKKPMNRASSSAAKKELWNNPFKDVVNNDLRKFLSFTN